MILKKYLVLLVLLLIYIPGTAQDTGEVLVIQDEMPQLEVLVPFLEENGNLDVQITDQQNIPEDFSRYQAVIGFIHFDLDPAAEKAIINYTENGGRFVCLHHTISGGKGENEYFFDFLGIQLDHPEFSNNPVEPGGGYGWYHDGDNYITLHLVNLNQQHFITNHKIEWEGNISYTPSDFPSAEGSYPKITLSETEVYLNHKFTDGREKQVLAGFKFYDQRVNRIYMQDRAVWLKDYGEGEIVYILPGENKSDYENNKIAQMILNAVIWEN